MITIDFQDESIDVACSHEKRGGPIVVCLHGLQSNKEAFAPLIEQCIAHDFSTLALDFVGFGRSARPMNFSYKLEAQAEVIAKALDTFRLQSFFLIGHSMGGMVGTMLLERYREQMLGFINMEGNFVFADCGASLPTSEASAEAFSQKLYPELKRSLETSKEPSAASRRRWLESTADYAFYGASKSIVEWSRSEKLIPMYVQSPVKKLFVYGEQNGRKKDVLPTSETAVAIPNAGHFMLADNPKSTIDVIEKFLTSSDE